MAWQKREKWFCKAHSFRCPYEPAKLWSCSLKAGKQPWALRPFKCGQARARRTCAKTCLDSGAAARALTSRRLDAGEFVAANTADRKRSARIMPTTDALFWHSETLTDGNMPGGNISSSRRGPPASHRCSRCRSSGCVREQLALSPGDGHARKWLTLFR